MNDAYLNACLRANIQHRFQKGDLYVYDGDLYTWEYPVFPSPTWAPRLDQWLDLIVDLAVKKNPEQADEYRRSGHRDAIQAILAQMDVALRGEGAGIPPELAAVQVYELLLQMP